MVNAANTQAANWANVERAQNVSDTNTIADYQAALENLNRRNALTQQGYQNEVSRLGGLTGQLSNIARARDAAGAAYRDTAQGLGAALGQAVGGGASLLSPSLASLGKTEKKKDKTGY
jgi:hypothetical protein